MSTWDSFENRWDSTLLYCLDGQLLLKYMLEVSLPTLNPLREIHNVALGFFREQVRYYYSSLLRWANLAQVYVGSVSANAQFTLNRINSRVRIGGKS